MSVNRVKDLIVGDDVYFGNTEGIKGIVLGFRHPANAVAILEKFYDRYNDPRSLYEAGLSNEDPALWDNWFKVVFKDTCGDATGVGTLEFLPAEPNLPSTPSNMTKLYQFLHGQKGWKYIEYIREGVTDIGCLDNTDEKREDTMSIGELQGYALLDVQDGPGYLQLYFKGRDKPLCCHDPDLASKNYQLITDALERGDSWIKLEDSNWHTSINLDDLYCMQFWID